MKTYSILQSKINSIDDKYSEIVELVLQNDFSKTEEGVDELAHEIFQTSIIRPKAGKNLAGLVKALVLEAKEGNKLAKLGKSILGQFLIYTQQKEKAGQLYSAAKFLRNVYSLQVLDATEIENTINKITFQRFADVLHDVFIPEFGSQKVPYSAWPKSIITETWVPETLQIFDDYLNNDGEQGSLISAIRADDPTPMMVNRFNYKKQLYSEEIFESKPIVNIAAFYGSEKCFNRIVSCISDFNDQLAKDAVIGGNLEIVKFCQEHNINCAKEIILAIEYHHPEIYDYLAEKNQDYESTSLITAELSANFMHLLAKKTEANEVDSFHFGQAVILGHYKAASFAAEKSSSLFTRHEILTAAVVNGMPSIVAAFLKSDPKYAKRFPNSNSDLYTAVINNRDNVVNCLLDFPVDVNQCSPAHVLAKEGKLELIKKFFSREDFQPYLKNKEGLTLLNCAIMSGKMEIIEYIFEKCPEVDNKDNLGHTPFHKAISLLNIPVAGFFLSKGANVNEPDSTGRTPLHTAAALGDIETVRYLLNIPGININAQTQHKRTPLHDALKKGNIDVIKAIAAFPGLNPNIKDDADRTTLHEAVLGGRTVSAEVILNIKNIDKNAKCKGKTAFKLASTKEMRQLVLENGGHK